MNPRRVILVVGPPLAGVDGMLAAMRARLPEHTVVGVADSGGPTTAPDAVVAVVSAVAPLVRSDWALVERVAARTDLVLGAVSKIDAHRRWRDVLAADRDLVTGWSARGGSVSWVGVTAAPRLGEPNVADLLDVLVTRLNDPHLDGRNAARRDAYDRSRQRAEQSARTRSATVEARIELQRVRLGLLGVVRAGCSALRTELRDAAAAVPAGGLADFEARVRGDVGRLVADIDEEITRAIAELATDATPMSRPIPVEVGPAPPSSGRLETRLMVVLGAGFGLGVALAASRLLTGLARGPSLVGWGAGAVVGVAAVLWVVRARGLLQRRALLDRWVCDVAAAVKWHGEAAVAERLLAVEPAAGRSRQRVDSVTDQ